MGWSKRPRGITLMELVIVIVVIGILAGMALPSWLRAREAGLVRQAGQILQTIRHAQSIYRVDTGGYAANLNTLVAQRYLPQDPSAATSDWDFTTGGAGGGTATRTGGGAAYNNTTVVLDEAGAVTGASTHPLAGHADFN